MYFNYALPYNKQFFANIRHRPHAVLLQSTLYSNGRYDILSAEPRCMLTTYEKQSVIQDAHQQIVITDDPLDYLIAQLPTTLPQSPYPFIGGLIGYATYDWGLSLQKITRHISPHHSLPLLKVGIYDWAIIIDHHQQTSTYVSYDLMKDHRSFIATLLDDYSSETTPFQLLNDWRSNIDYQQYQQNFWCIQEHLHAGDCYQVNLTQCFAAEYQGDPWYAYQQLITDCSAAFCAYLNYGDHHILSVSPERFIKVQQQQAITQPIKGTRPRGKTIADDENLAQALQHSDKDRAENVMIVDMLRNDLGRMCITGSIEVSELCALHSYHNVHHLVSTIQGQLPDTIHPLHLLKSMFPGASITGAPKKRVMEIIESLENQRRHIYCGSIFYYSADGQLDSNIAIRSALCHQGRIEISGGGGIVLDSNAADEYQEIQSKIAHMLFAFE